MTRPAPIPNRMRASISPRASSPSAKAGSPRAAMARSRAAPSSRKTMAMSRADRLAPHCPATRTLRAGAAGELVTQYEFAKAGIITEEMIYVAHRENLAREAAIENAAAKIADGESFGAEIPNSSRPNSSARKWRAAARSFPPTSTTSNSSRWRSVATSSSRSTPTSAIRR